MNLFDIIKTRRTARRSTIKKRGVGYTRKNKKQSKARRQMAKKSRRINRGK